MPTVDAMVTGRMPAGKKRAGNDVLAALGLTASQAINELYDYLVSHGEMPFHGEPVESKSQLEDALAYVDSFPFVTLDGEYSTMDARAARAERLGRRYGEVAGVACEVNE